jgi:hypothetical protein
LVVYEKIPPRLLPSHLPFLSAHIIPLVASHKSIGSRQLMFNDAFAIFFDIIFKVLSFNFFTCLYRGFRGYGGETKGDETKIRKLWRNASHISFVESNNFRNFPRSGMGNKTKIK